MRCLKRRPGHLTPKNCDPDPEFMVLFDAFAAGPLRLNNRIVMAPMTRNRALGNTANALMAQYYGQRAAAGLIITEGTSPSPNGLGYARMPGLFSAGHVAGWRVVTDAVHANGGKIFVQLMHTGRVGHPINLPPHAQLLAPCADPCLRDIHTDLHGMQRCGQPRAMTRTEIAQAVDEYASAASLAMEAGFDGVELHGANGYLIEQFLNSNVNRRSDEYGGTRMGRNRFAVDVAKAVANAIGPQRVGMRLSPYGTYNGTGGFPGMERQFLELAEELSRIGLLYVHLVDHSSMGAPAIPDAFKLDLRKAFRGLFIASGGFDRSRAEDVLVAKRADLIAFGRGFLANPDLVERMRVGAPLNAPDDRYFYTPGPRGYTDYPAYVQ